MDGAAAHWPGFTAGTLAIAFAAFAVGGLLKGATGFGLPMTTVSLMSMVLPPPVALGINVLPPLVLNLWQMGRWRSIRASLAAHWPVVLGLVLGTALGAGFAADVDAAMLRRIIGAITILFCLVMLLGVRPPKLRRRRPAGLAFGTVAGGIGALTTVDGPPLVMYLLATRAEPQAFRHALGLFFVTGSACFAVAFSAIGFLTLERAAVSLLCLLPAAGGMWLGRRLAGRLDAKAFQRLVLVALMLVGLVLALGL